MANKKKQEGKITKSFSFKVKECNQMDKIVCGLNEYKNYYNSLSKWLCSKLTTMTIGEAASYIPEKKRNTKYYQAATDILWCDKPLYEIFTKKFEKDGNFSVEEIGNSNNANNILYELVKKINPEGYNGNVFGLDDTCYRKHGYIMAVFSNYKTKIRAMKMKVGRKTIGNDSTHEDMLTQALYELTKNGLDSVSAYQDKISYLKTKEDCNEKLVERLMLLSDFYKNNTDEILEKQKVMAVEDLVNFGGCTMHIDRQSMSISKQTIELSKKYNANGYILTVPIGRGNELKFDLWGRRDVIKNGNILVDIEKEHGDSVVMKLVNGELYIDIACDVDFNKKQNEGGNIVGIDVNTKHMLMVANIGNDAKLDGYINIYKMLAEDVELNNILKNDEIMTHIKENGDVIGFVPIEFELLMSRVLGFSDKYKMAEERVKTILKEQAGRFAKEGKDNERIYLQNIVKFREYLKRLVYLKNKYNDAQSKYTLDMGYVDESTESGDTMDKRRFESPFVNTDIAQKILNEIRVFEDRITGCKDCLMTYVYKLFEANGYSLINMEYLESSSFKSRKGFPTTVSMLKFHKLLGKTKEEALNNETYNKYKEYYVPIYTDGKISDIEYSAKGKVGKLKNLAMNIVIKAIHFAETKDIMTRCANNGRVSVGYVPSFYTSMIDSKTHKLPVTENTKICSKKKIRRKQEYHVNKMNADNNAASNIRYFGENTVWRDNMCQRTLNGYNEPLYKPKVKTSKGMFDTLKKMNALQVLDSK